MQVCFLVHFHDRVLNNYVVRGIEYEIIFCEGSSYVYDEFANQSIFFVILSSTNSAYDFMRVENKI